MTQDAKLHGQFRFMPVDKVIFGQGTLNRLGQEVDRLGCRRAMIVTGQSLTQNGFVKRVEEQLGERWAGTYSGIRQHALSETVTGAIKKARELNPDILISFGGGSPVDSTKCVARALADNITDARELMGRLGGSTPRSQGTFIPHIAIPTTLSAAEFTSIAGGTDESTRVKGGFGDDRVTPRVVILDPELTTATGDQLWTSTGIKALDHAVEAIYSSTHQPLTDAAALEAIRLLFTYLPASIRQPLDLETRVQCQVAAWLSIMGVANVRLGLSHAFGHQIGARCNVPHGITSCITLPIVMRFLAPVTADRQALMARAMGIDMRNLSDEAAAVAAANAVSDLIHDLGLPSTFREVGVSEEDLRAIAEASFHEAASSNSPRRISSAEEIVQVLKQAW